MGMLLTPATNVSASQPVFQRTLASIDYMPGRVWVLLTSDELHPVSAGQIEAGISSSVVKDYGIYDVRKGFPSLDLVAAKRELSESAELVRRVYTLSFSRSIDPRLVATALRDLPNVIFAEPHYVMEPAMESTSDDPMYGIAAIPNDPLFNSGEYMGRMRMVDAWDIQKGDNGNVVVAIVDLGTDWKHPDLRANTWTNKQEIPGNGIDDDGNGYADDLHGWNFASNEADPSPLVRAEGNDEHGTLVTGIAAAVTNNEIGTVGTSWNATFMAVNVGCADYLGQICHHLEGSVYAAMNGADIINASYSSRMYSQTAELVYQMVHDKGVLVVAAAGNDRQNIDIAPTYPASFATTLSVGGTARLRDLNRYNYGRNVNVFAAGEGVLSTAIGGLYSRSGGTSMAAPLVAGIAALVKTSNPSYSPDKVREQIRITADNIDFDNPASLQGLLGRGRVNALRALTESGVPAVRANKIRFARSDNSPSFFSGDSVSIYIHYVNHLAVGDGLAVELVTFDPYVHISRRRHDLGRFESGSSRSVMFAVDLAEETPYRYRTNIHSRITSPVYTDDVDAFGFEVNPGSVATLSTGALRVSVTSEANVGFLDYAHNSEGKGFLVSMGNGEHRQVMIEAGLVVGTGPATVLHSVTLNTQQARDFVPADVRQPVTVVHGQLITQQGTFVFSDREARTPLGVRVLQESFADSSDNHRDFIVLRYSVENDSSTPLSDLHVGIYVDWETRYGRGEFSDSDKTRRVGYQQNHRDTPDLVVGTALLSSDQAFHFRAIDSGLSAGSAGARGSDRLLWSMLSGGNQRSEFRIGNWSQLVGSGGFGVEPGHRIDVAFALVTGGSVREFLTNVDHAQALWDQVVDPAAGVQFIQHMSRPGVDVYVNDSLVASNLAFPSATQFRRLSPGRSRIDVVGPGESGSRGIVASEEVLFEAGQDYNIVTYDTSDEAHVYVSPEVRRRSIGKDLVTGYVVHAAGNTGNVDILLDGPDGVGGRRSIALATDLGLASASGYVSVLTGDYTLQILDSQGRVEIEAFEINLGEHVGQESLVFVLSQSEILSDRVEVTGYDRLGRPIAASTVTSNEHNAVLPSVFEFHGNYPNPFNGMTYVLLDLPARAVVNGEVIDLLGRRMLSVGPVTIHAGAMRRIEVDFGGKAAGVYLYRIVANTGDKEYIQTGKMMYVR